MMRLAWQAHPVLRTPLYRGAVANGVRPLGLCTGCACRSTSNGYACAKDDGTDCDDSCKSTNCCGVTDDCYHDPICGGLGDA